MVNQEKMSREFHLIIEGDSDGYLVASIPSLRGCHTLAKSWEELIERIHRGDRYEFGDGGRISS